MKIQIVLWGFVRLTEKSPIGDKGINPKIGHKNLSSIYPMHRATGEFHLALMIRKQKKSSVLKSKLQKE